MCKRCIDSQPRCREPAEPKNSMVKANIRKVCSGRDQPQPPPDDRTKLPYDVSSLDTLLTYLYAYDEFKTFLQISSLRCLAGTRITG